MKEYSEEKVFDYSDYRIFLQYYFMEQKKFKKNHSFESLGSSEYAYYENWYNLKMESIFKIQNLLHQKKFHLLF